MEDNLRSYKTRFYYETDIFTDDFIKHCKNNANESHKKPIEVKNNIRQMTMEQVLYAQVVMLFRKDLNITEENRNKNEAKFKLQVQSARLQCWFDLDFD